MHYPRWSSNSSSATSPKSPGIISNMCLGRSRTSKIDEDSTVTFRVQLVELVKTLNQLCFVWFFCLFSPFIVSSFFLFVWFPDFCAFSIFLGVFFRLRVPTMPSEGFLLTWRSGAWWNFVSIDFYIFLLRNWFSLLIKGVPYISSFTSFCHVILSWPFVIFSILINAFLFSFPCSSGLLVFLGSASFLDSDA